MDIVVKLLTTVSQFRYLLLHFTPSSNQPSLSSLTEPFACPYYGPNTQHKVRSYWHQPRGVNRGSTLEVVAMIWLAAIQPKSANHLRTILGRLPLLL